MRPAFNEAVTGSAEGSKSGASGTRSDSRDGATTVGGASVYARSEAGGDGAKSEAGGTAVNSAASS